MFLEALYGEAPKGQPMICGENLEVVCVEAPQGQPGNHRPHPRKQSTRVPKGKEPKSPWKKDKNTIVAVEETWGRRRKEVGDHSREPMH